MAPIRQVATLRGAVRPVVAGVQINFPGFLCGLGFNATRRGIRGFVTASHCTSSTDLTIAGWNKVGRTTGWSRGKVVGRTTARRSCSVRSRTSPASSARSRPTDVPSRHLS